MTEKFNGQKFEPSNSGERDYSFVGPFPKSEILRPTIDFYENIKSYEDVPYLVDDIHRVVCSAFGRPDFDKSDTRSHIKGDVLMAAYEGDQMIAFNTIMFGSARELLRDESLPDNPGVYFAAAAIAKEFQGKGVYQAMNEKRFQLALREEADLVYTRTQNPLVETGITHYIKRLQDQGKIRGYALDRYFVDSCYGEMLSSERPPESPDMEIQQAYDQLNPEQGDAYVLMFTLQK